MDESQEFTFEILGTIRARDRREAWYRVRRVLEVAGFHDIGDDTLAPALPELRDAEGLALSDYQLQIDALWIQVPIDAPGEATT